MPTLEYLGPQPGQPHLHLFQRSAPGRPPVERVLEEPPVSLLEGDLAWLLGRWLNEDPGLPELALCARQVAEALSAWGRRAGAALERGDALEGPLALVGLDPERARWPWEWLRGASGALIAAERGLSRCLRSAPVPARGPLPGPPPGPLRVLLVIARQAGREAEADIGYRNVARALQEAKAAAPEALEVELLPRPCTLAAVRARLQQRPPVHVLHIDAHGQDGGLELEDERLDRAHHGPQSVGDALGSCAPPLVVLNACDSAIGAPGGHARDVSAELHQRGVPGVLGMQAPLRVEAATLLVRAFYAELVRSGSALEATRAAREALAADPMRWSNNQSFELPDAGVPLLYLHHEPALPAVGRSKRPGKPRAPQPAPMDWTLLNLDRALHLAHGPVVLHGLAGGGKSTLLHDAKRWWRDMGWVTARAVDWAKEEDHSPARVLAELGRARPARGLKAPRRWVWDHVEALALEGWERAEVERFRQAVAALAEAGVQLLLVGRSPLREVLPTATRVAHLGLREDEAWPFVRALAAPAPGAHLGAAAPQQRALEGLVRRALHHPGVLAAGARALLAGEGHGLDPGSRLPAALHPAWEALEGSLERAQVPRSPRVLGALRAGLAPDGRVLSVPLRADPVDLSAYERAGALCRRTDLDGGGEHRYTVHALFPRWLSGQQVPPPATLEHREDLARALAAAGRDPVALLPRLGLSPPAGRDAAAWVQALARLGEDTAHPQLALAALLEAARRDSSDRLLEAWALRLRPDPARYPLFGARLHLSGSANQAADPALLARAHAFVRALVLEGLRRGARWTVAQGTEDNPAWDARRLFDGAVLRAVHEGCQRLGLTPAPLLVCANPQQVPAQCRPETQALYQALERRPGVCWVSTDPLAHNGGRLRALVAEHTDLAVLLSGGVGTADLYKALKERRGASLPLDLDLGDIGGSTRRVFLFTRFAENPADFLPQTGGRALAERSAWTLQGPEVDVEAAARRVLDLLAAEWAART